MLKERKERKHKFMQSKAEILPKEIQARIKENEKPRIAIMDQSDHEKNRDLLPIQS